MNSEAVYQDSKQRIIREGLIPRQYLIERERDDTYDISRAPIREVLRKLESKGFLELNPGKGYLIRKFSLKEIIEIFQDQSVY